MQAYIQPDAMALRGFSAFALFWPYFLLPLGNAMSCEEALDQISDEIKQHTLCDSQISTHLADLVQDIHTMTDKNKDLDTSPIPGCHIPTSGSIPNGQIKQTVDWLGKDMLWFKCNEGFVLRGNPALVCRGNSWNGSLPVCIAIDCMSHRSAGQEKDQVYGISPNGHDPMLAYCDMTTDGGGWTIFQRRVDGKVNFYRGYQEYQQGFGDLEGNIWLGLDMLHVLTESDSELFVDMIANETQKAFARYESFTVADQSDGYRLKVSGYSGTAGDSLAVHNGQKFSTYDRDQDVYSGNCAKNYKGAWWYKGCHHSNLNGLYLNGPHKSGANGVNWLTFSGHYYSMKQVEMKVRRKV